MIITQTPVRISFFGGGTDFPEFFSRHGGAVLSTTIDKFCYLTVSYLSDFFDYRIKVTYSKTELLSDYEKIEHPAVKACLAHTGITSNIEINYFSDLPARTGLGTSSSFVVGLLRALYAYRGRRVSSRQLAEEAVYLEREVVNEHVGLQDQYAAAFGGFNYIEFEGENSVRVEKVVYNPELFGELADNLLLFYTGIQRYSNSIQKNHVANIEDNTRDLIQLKELASAGRDILGREDGSLDQFGELLHRGWELKRSLSAGITNPRIDEYYHTAREAGAVGGKLLGAGGGGFLLFYVPPSRQAAVRQALASLLEVDFSFEKNGPQVIFYDPDKLGAPSQ